MFTLSSVDTYCDIGGNLRRHRIMTQAAYGGYNAYRLTCLTFVKERKEKEKKKKRKKKKEKKKAARQHRHYPVSTAPSFSFLCKYL